VVGVTYPGVMTIGLGASTGATVAAREPVVVEAAGRHGWPAVAYSAAAPAALLGGGTLLVGKTVVSRVTVAVAE
jgi:hypothetical protein